MAQHQVGSMGGGTSSCGCCWARTLTEYVRADAATVLPLRCPPWQPACLGKPLFGQALT